MSTEKVFFPNQDGVQLAAYLETPDNGAADHYALFAHCFTCTKNIKAAGNISAALAQRNIAVMRFDFTGLGESEGDFSDTNFSSNIDDLVSASEFLSKEYQAPEILIGHSLGGAAVLQAAQRVPSCKAVATIGAPSDPAHVQRLFSDELETIESKGQADVNLAGRAFTIKKQFVDDLNQDRMDNSIDQLGRALIIFHSPIDRVVDVDNASNIFKKARHPKSFISLDQADHLLMKEDDSRYVGELISCWAKKYV